ncbi:lipopolysaccharide transport periplasmic protein LptA [Arenimonas terrae]|uniref:Lipopolysaccharide export system protein LptA n=1 Tax=Arenimonas terrae TaxID=2546226 RepID=A0A5C4RWT3_9GAMM|nr:lipopolysaccharide transport periplasmic protein LptA [Arenimonas terrae]TNJ35402.1 lipopolysaccharide transport periplasmic protein LptA [Arenimonas terrae]
MRPAARDLLLLLSLLAAAPALAKSTDRDQPMDINADSSDSLLQDNGMSVLEGNVTIRQGTLKVDADRAEVHRRNGEIERIVLIGAPARLRQVSDSGEAMDARARQVVYTLSDENMVLTGAVEIRQPRGTLRGETVKYDINTGRLNGGGDGQRVSMRILPKTAAAD